MNQKLFQIKKNSKIFVAGHKGLIGSAFIRRFNADKYSNKSNHIKADMIFMFVHEALILRKKRILKLFLI